MMPPYDARAVANFLLDHAEGRGVRLTQLSLLKVIYFAHGWYLTAHGRPLVAQDFEAWAYGPVIKVVRDSFKQHGRGEISSRATRLDIFSGEKLEVPPVLGDEDTTFILKIFDAYHIFDAWQLSEMTHERGSPWDRIWNAEVARGRIGLRIRNEEIKAHFDALAARLGVS